jgi:BirA family transcriptional regulator, biotin operon repressor / biotin---[acetyl-CoA-carboxylase] ligase
MRKALEISEINENLNTKYMGRRITYFEEIGSTNDEAKRLGELGAEEGTLIIAEDQTLGRGRMLRRWQTYPYDSIAMTLLVKPKIAPREAPTITPVLALSVIEALREIYNINALIKWPNDIVLDNKKICGILTEMNTGMEEIKYIAIGMGLNVNVEDLGEELSNIGTSLKICTGITSSREIIISRILNNFEINYENFIKFGLGFFRNELKKYSSILNKEIIVISGLEMVEGLAEDLDDNGNLKLRLEDGRIKNIIYGDVSIKCKEVLKG